MDEERRYLEALARDDRSAFDALYLKYAAKTEEFLYRMLKDHSEAEDITQDIFLKIWRNRTSIGAVDAFGPYLFRMARNAVYDRFDSRSVRENYARRGQPAARIRASRQRHRQPRPAAADPHGCRKNARTTAPDLPHEPRRGAFERPDRRTALHQPPHGREPDFPRPGRAAEACEADSFLFLKNNSTCDVRSPDMNRLIGKRANHYAQKLYKRDHRNIPRE